MPAFQFLRDNLMQHTFSKGTFTPATTLWVGLITAVGTDTGGYTEVTTLNSAYGRVGVTSAGWTTANTTAVSFIKNTSAIVFPTPTTDWGTVVGAILTDSSQAGAGNGYFYTTFTAVAINAGSSVQFATTALEFSGD